MSQGHDQGRVPAEVRDAVERAASELFVGRERELAALDSALKEAIGGRGRVCLIAGEPGIGKTRLAESLATIAGEHGANVVWGRCWEGDGAPAFWPWVQVLRACIRQCNVATLAGRLGPGASYVAQIVPELRELLPDLSVAPALDSEQTRFRLYDACSAFLRIAAGDAPLVLVLDDLHWADTSSLLLLQFLAREIADARMLVVATYRDVEVSRGHPLADVLPRLRRERTVDRILLRGLGQDEVHTLLARLRGDEVPEEFTGTITRETAGNPFFIREILRHLLDEGIARREGDRWVGDVSFDEIALPESVREVIGRRLARLGDACGELLTLASVIGAEFGLDVLRRLGNLEEEHLFEAVEEAVAARVIDEAPEAIGRYRFAHALVRETLYDEMRNLERVRLHRRIAEILEGLYARDADAHLTELAHHFLEGLPGGDVDKAVAYAIRAGDRANEQFAHAEAANHYGRALQALELKESPDDRLRCEVLLKVGEARWSAGGFAKTTEPLEEAAALAERIGSPELLARAALALGGPGVGVGSSLDWHLLALVEKALAALDESDGALRARMMARLAHMRTFVGNQHGKEALARKAVEMARRVGDPRALAYVLCATPWANGGPDDMAERLARADELIALADDIGDERLAAEGHTWKACASLEMGDVTRADREIAMGRRLAESSRQPFHRWLAQLDDGARLVFEGHCNEGEALLQRALQFAHDVQLAGTFSMSLAGKSFWIFLGRAEESLPEFVHAANEFPEIHMWRVNAAVMRLACGHVEAARQDLESLATKDFRDIPRDLMWMHTMVRLAELVGFFRDARRAALLYELLLPYADRYVIAGILATCRGSVSWPLGVLATVLSRYDDAQRHFEAALEMNARIRARMWVAYTQYDYARMLVTRDGPGDRATAAALARDALAMACKGGLKPLEAQLRELCAMIGDEPSNVAPVAVEPPTSQLAAFRRDGDVWSIAYEGQRFRLRDAKGVQYIAHLLRHEGRECHAAELAAGGDGGTAGPSDASVVRGLGDAGEVLDAQARGEYRERLESLRAELEEATRWGDSGRAARLGEEIDFLTEELASALGVGGRARKAGDVADRARKAVTSRIRDTIARIAKEHPTLGRHLENAIRTGAFCCYRPDRSPGWTL